MRAFSILLRTAAAALFVVALLGFSLPFIALNGTGRWGAATGLELAFGEAERGGRRADAALGDEIERRLDGSRLPALVALAASAAGLIAILLPGRGGPRLALLAALAALAGLAWILVVTASPEVALATDRRYGLWFTGIVLAAGGLAATLALLSRPAERPSGR